MNNLYGLRFLLFLPVILFPSFLQAQTLQLVAREYKTTDDNGGIVFVQDTIDYDYYEPKAHVILPFFSEYGLFTIDRLSNKYPETDFDKFSESRTSGNTRLESKAIRYKTNGRVDSTIVFVPEKLTPISKNIFEYNDDELLAFEIDYSYVDEEPQIDWVSKSETTYEYENGLLVKKVKNRLGPQLQILEITTDIYEYNSNGQVSLHKQFVKKYSNDELIHFEIQNFYNANNLLDSTYYVKHSLFGGDPNIRTHKYFYDPVSQRIDSLLWYTPNANNEFQINSKRFYEYNTSDQLVVYSEAGAYQNFEIRSQLFFEYNQDGNLSRMTNCPGDLQDCNVYQNTIFVYGDQLISTVKDQESETITTLYPNPVGQSVLTVGTNKPIERIEVVDMNGRLVHFSKSSSKEINVSSLIEGQYICKVFYKNEVMSFKFLKI